MGWDVIVVGAGPAGSAVAAHLGQEGFRVLLLERSGAPPPKVCGEYLSPGCLRILDRLHLLTPLCQAGARPIRGLEIHTARGRLWRPAHPPHAAPGPSHGLAVSRSLLDPLLLQRAIEAGARLETNFQVSELLWEREAVVGVRGRHAGRVASFRSRLVIGADGRNSAVARRLGAVRRLAWLDKVALVAYLEGAERAADRGEIFLGADRYAILNPLGSSLTNLGLVLNRQDLCPAADPSALLLALAPTLPGLAERLTHARIVRPVRRLGPLAFRAGRLTAPGAALVGDAAGFLDPLTGDGIYAGLRGAELAAHFAAAALLGEDAPSPNLRPYGAAWAREVAARWRLAGLLQRAIRHPRLADGLVALLASRPALGQRLLATITDPAPSLP